MGTLIKDKTLMELLGEKHDDWTYMLRSMLKGKSYIQPDEEIAILGEMYIRMDKYVTDPSKIMYGDEINTMFVFTVLRNVLNAYFNKKNKNPEFSVEVIFDSADEEYDIQYDIEKVELTDSIINEIESWHWFPARMFKLINQDGVSMRQLSRDTQISLSTVFNGNKKSKELLKAKFQIRYNKLNN